MRGMRVLQLVIETITGKPVETLMQELVFRPFGMSRTNIAWQANFNGDYANGYNKWKSLALKSEIRLTQRDR